MLKWRENIKKWFRDSSVSGNLISDTDEDTLAPLLLKERLTFGKTTVIVLPVMNQAEHLAAGIAAWNQEFKLGFQSLYLPETMEGGKYVPENEADRARALYDSLKSKYDIIIGSAASFLAPVPDPETVLAAEIILRPGMEYSFTGLLEKLVELDYDDEFEVNVKGEFSRRGGIIDVFSPSCDYPVRIEFWGDQIETMRKFSPDSQRSVGEVDEYRIIGRTGLDMDSTGVDFFNYLDKISAELVVVFPDECLEHLENFSSEVELERFKSVLDKYAHGRLVRVQDVTLDAGLEHQRRSDCFPAVAHLRKSMPKEIRDGGMEILRKLISDQIRQWLDTGYTVALLGNDKASCTHIKRWCKLYDIDSVKVEIDIAGIAEGVIFPQAKTVFLGEKELFTANLFKRKSSSLPGSKSQPAPAIAEEAAALADLDEGDYAVHLIHGIGIFRGFREIDAKGVKREVIVMEYQDSAMLYVPVWQAGMVSRYIGSQATVTLHKIGGRKWVTAKIEAVKAVRDFAADMLRFQAVRNSTEGTVFPEDDLEQRVFEDAFPYEDTVDQKRAVVEIKADMHKTRPMDRLLCGDVGYGKTEVAIRVAFKAVMAGYQVAILVPTTVLAQQHYYSFTERFAQYPIVIEMLSRFRSPVEQKQIIEKMRSGGIDIIIGTHRLIQEDVGFAKLGLVIIDEEQRFGVKHKERLKHFRTAVDVLTMSATPIPRTLYMAMTGARDLSTIMTAPGLRLPIQTIVSHYDEKFVVESIRKEIKRGGQVFYIHNRIKTIQETADSLKRLLPEVKFAVGHGQMEEEELELAMTRFLSGKIDVLVCTTIIESGLDIPNANTIIIERADRFGLAELYQLRGRVGRWNRQAYACLLLPKEQVISSDARKRISAIRRYTHLGAGFRLALRDLEIRGAGNLLGAEQSGHINTIGFDLYCQLLRSEVSRMSGGEDEFMPTVDVTIEFVDFAHEAPEGHLAAGFPPEYIVAERLRMEAYRRLGSFTHAAELPEFADELEDRFGSLPEPAKNMFKVVEVKIHAARAGYSSVSVADNKVYFKGDAGIYRRNGMIPVINPANSPKFKLDNLLEIARLVRPVES